MRNFRASEWESLLSRNERSRKCRINEINAEIAQLVEHNLAKVGVASSSLVFRSWGQQFAVFFCFYMFCGIFVQAKGKVFFHAMSAAKNGLNLWNKCGNSSVGRAQPCPKKIRMQHCLSMLGSRVRASFCNATPFCSRQSEKVFPLLSFVQEFRSWGQLLAVFFVCVCFVEFWVRKWGRVGLWILRGDYSHRSITGGLLRIIPLYRFCEITIGGLP